jgi:hypothetical protein
MRYNGYMMKKGTLMETEKQSVAVIHDNRDRQGNRISIGAVAMMEVDISTDPTLMQKMEVLDKAFEMTNTIDSPWFENNEITKMFDGEGCRSTSVGDFVLLGASKWKCEPNGWKEV